ncbi:MAG: hypothetical protein IH946_06330 [Bacteroidetes bacterium]|nr:hypothetical protein [Bacteroidota bacterium]
MNVFPAPVVDAGSDQIVCAGISCVALNGTVSGGSSTGIWSTSGTGTFSPNDSSLIGCYIPSAADTTTGVVIIELTSTNNGICLPVIDTMIITINSGPDFNTGSMVIDSSTCSNSDGSITGIIVSGGAPPLTYEWVDDFLTVVGGDSAHLLNVPSGSYTLTVTDSNDCTTSDSVFIDEIIFDLQINSQSTACDTSEGELIAIMGK